MQNSQKIHLLENSLINKIAAGEVIENPASVVKELIENSLDAGSTEINIELKEGGKSYIKITDNGQGMTEQDAKLCFERHATSKISRPEDLFNISSLGFRGEALASIAAISNLKITTKTEDSLEGFLIEIESGKILKQAKIGCKTGTKIEVSNLFFNTPVRKKYLKDINTELNKILDLITRFSFRHQNISFNLTHNEKPLFNSPKTDNLLEKIITAYGKETSKQMLKIDYKNRIEVNGFISKPGLTRSDKKQQTIFINDRNITNDVITKATYEAYRTLLFHNRHPLLILKIKLDPEDIDVNVHPTKKTVKLKKEQEIYNEVVSAISQTLNKNNLIPEANIQESNAKPTQKYSFSQDKQTLLTVKETPKNEYNEIQKDEPISNSIGPIKILGQINKTFILAENNKGMLIIDQHAAQERILYEEFMQKYENKGIKKQKLLKPLILELSAAETDLVNKNLETFASLGFELEDYGSNSILIRSVPYIFERFNKNLFLDILSEINDIKKQAVEKTKEERIIRFACRKAIKAGLELTNLQIQELIEDLEKTETPYTCPHGRPTMLNITLAELERKFKRTG